VLRSAGADAISMRRRFAASSESLAHPRYRERLVASSGANTVLTNLFTGRPARGMVNRVIREMGAINPAAPEFPLATSAITPLRQKAEAAGSGDFSPLWSGQNASGCREIGAAEMTRALAGKA
jgi:nitronate monooxygenase